MWRTAESPRITVADFFEAGRNVLQMDWEANPEAAVGREITEVALNRPGLALAGFLRYFANRRIQVLGLAEMTYLSSLPLEQRTEIRTKGSSTSWTVSSWMVTERDFRSTASPARTRS